MAEISKRPDVNPKEGTSQYGDVSFADEKNKKYPIDTAEHIRAAWNYINQARNAGKYSAEEVATIKHKIVAAWKDKIDKDGPPGADKSVEIADADEMVIFGGAVKAVKMEDGSVKFSGPLITFSDENTPDLTGDFFASDTDFGESETADVYFNHRMPLEAGGHCIDYKSKLGKATLTRTDAAIFAETILKARNEYEQAIIDAGLAGQLGWSSGTANHLTDRQDIAGKAFKITKWPLGLDASLTPTPAEPRHKVVSLKSLSVDTTATSHETEGEPEAVTTAASEATGEAVKTTKSILGANKMTPEELKAQQEMLLQVAKDAGKAGADEAVKAMKAAAPAPDTAGTSVTVTLAEGDRKFANLAEQARAVKTASRGGRIDQRLLRLNKVSQEMDEAAMKATGANEAIPADAGYLLEPTIGNELLVPIHQEGPLSSLVRRLPVGANSNFGYINGIDETSRATGSRWGGVQGYRIAEGVSITASRPKFRRINWELKKYAVLMYATDELILDAAQFNEVAKQSAGEELNFMVNDDIVNGTGIGGAQGMLISGAMITVTRQNASAVIHQDILNMWQRLLPWTRKNAQWFINSEVEPQLDALYFAGLSTGVLSPYVSYGVDGVLRLMGKPVTVTEFNPGLGTAGDIILADMSQYLFWEKGDVQAATSIHIAFLTDEEAFRFVYRSDGQTAHYKPVTMYKSSSGTLTQSPFVSLLATS